MFQENQIIKLPSSVYSCQNNIDLEKAEKYGKKLYNENETYKKLSNLMEHPEFRDFFSKNFNDWYDIKTIIMFMKIYEMIEQKTKNLNGYQKIAFLDAIMKDSGMRRHMVDKIIENTNGNRLF